MLRNQIGQVVERLRQCFFTVNSYNFLVIRMNFNAEKELGKIKSQRKSMRKKRYTPSRLDKLKFEILSLKKEKASLSDIQCFLKTKHIKVALSTIHRFIKKHG